MGWQADVRSACMTTLDAYASGANVKLATYPGRPASLAPPHAFVDVLREENVVSGHLMQRTVQADIVIVWGLFDSKVAVEQKDAFVDGYIVYLRDVPNYASAGPSSLFRVASTEDDSTFTPDWMDRANQRPYYATRITVEAYREE